MCRWDKQCLMPLSVCTIIFVWCVTSSAWCCPLEDIFMTPTCKMSWISYRKPPYFFFFFRWGPWSFCHHWDRWIVSHPEDGVFYVKMVRIIAPQCKCFLNHVGCSNTFTEVQTCPWSQLCDCTSLGAKQQAVASRLLSSISKIQNL